MRSARPPFTPGRLPFYNVPNARILLTNLFRWGDKRCRTVGLQLQTIIILAITLQVMALFAVERFRMQNNFL